MRYQIGLNPHRYSLRRNKIVVLNKENPNDRAKARMFLPLASTPLLSGKTRIKTMTKKISLTLNIIFVSIKAIMLINAPRKDQKTSVGLDNLHVGD